MQILACLINALALIVAAVGCPDESSAACRGSKRRTYIHVDNWDFTLTNELFIEYIKDLVTAGADTILIGRVMPGAGVAITSAGQLEALASNERADLMLFLKQHGSKLIMTIDGAGFGCSLQTLNVELTARKWCQYARDMGYDGVNWRLKSVTRKGRNLSVVDWITRLGEVCHQYVKLVTYTARSVDLDLDKDTLLVGAIKASTDPTDRFLVEFRDQSPSNASAADFSSDLRLLASFENEIPTAKGKLVMSKDLYQYGGSSDLSVQTLDHILQKAEKTGYNGGIAFNKAPPTWSAQLSHFLDTLLPGISHKPFNEEPSILMANMTSLTTVTPTTTEISSTKAAPQLPLKSRTTGYAAKGTSGASVAETSASSTNVGMAEQKETRKVKCTGVLPYEGGYYSVNEKARYRDSLWIAHAYTRRRPTGDHKEWSKVGDCDAAYTQLPPRLCKDPSWHPEMYYFGGDSVSYNHVKYTALRDTTPSDIPSPHKSTQAWEFVTRCFQPWEKLPPWRHSQN